MNKKIIYLTLISLYVFLVSDIAFPWEGKSHGEISGQALNISQLPQYLENELGFSFSSKRFSGPAHTKYSVVPMEFGLERNYTAQEWIMHGSEAEDELLQFFIPPMHIQYLVNHDMRAVNHYYNPFWDNSSIYPYPYPDFADPNSEENWSFQQGGLYDDLARGIAEWDLWVGKPSPRWAYDGLCPSPPQCPEPPPYSDFIRSDNNYFSWVYARKYFYAALSGDSTELDAAGGIEDKVNMNEDERDRCFALLFRSLGQLMHLIQDAGNPEHTRNDAHPLSSLPLGFENYADKQDFSSPSWSSSVIPWQLIVKSDTDNPIMDFFDSNRQGGGYNSSSSTGLAEFSNYNFLTKDSISDNIMHDYCEPNCEPHGHERHRFFTHPRINESQCTLEDGIFYQRYICWSENIVDPLGIYPTQNVRLANTRWYHNILRMLGSFDYSVWDDKVRNDYLDILIPRCVGYSAAFLDYFFRGAIEISAPDRFIYSIIDGKTTPQEFTHIKAKLRNKTVKEITDQGEIIYEEMGSGTLLAVARYKKRTDYQPDLSTDPPTAASREDHFSYSVSDPIAITELSSTEPKEFIFNFSDPIPAGITDLYLHVVFKGTLGNEKNTAIAVGMKDINEPQHIILANSTDRVYLDHALYTAEYVRSNPDLFDPSMLLFMEPYLDPYNDMDIGIAFFPDPAIYPTRLHAACLTMLAASYSRIIILAEEPSDEQPYFYYHVQWFSPSREDGQFGYAPMEGVINQDNSDGFFDNTEVQTFRGINAHLVRWVCWNSPDADGLMSADWPTMENEQPRSQVIWP